MNYILPGIFILAIIFNSIAMLKIHKLKRVYGVIFKRKLIKEESRPEIRTLVTSIYKLQNIGLLFIFIFFLLFILF